MMPVWYTWTGEDMKPWPRFHNVVNAEFVVGQNYQLTVTEDRSSASHKHYFACVNEAWANLPDHLAEQFATADHLRKFALIKTGYRDERSIVCTSKAEAQRVAAFIKPMDGYAVVVVSEALVTVYTAKSQSLKAQGRQTFAESKDAVLGYVADLIGVKPEQLAQSVAA